jgi:hypothetical protein
MCGGPEELEIAAPLALETPAAPVPVPVPVAVLEAEEEAEYLCA